MSSLSGYGVYEANAQFTDPQNNTPINQLTHRAIYGVSNSGKTRFAIVRTGSYAEYGFGGFVYQRDGGVTLPTSGQAIFTGQMAGMRDYKGSGGLDYTTADMEIAIDFQDFNPTNGKRQDAVRGRISNRKIYDLNGQEITSDVLARINAEHSTSLTAIPNAQFVIQPGALDKNGEMVGEITSNYVDQNGALQSYEKGKYYAIVAGDNADEVVGVVTLENSTDPKGTAVRETGGFILYR